MHASNIIFFKNADCSDTNDFIGCFDVDPCSGFCCYVSAPFCSGMSCNNCIGSDLHGFLGGNFCGAAPKVKACAVVQGTPCCLDLEESSPCSGQIWSMLSRICMPVHPKSLADVSSGNPSDCRSSVMQHRQDKTNVTCRAPDTMVFHSEGVRHEIRNMTMDESNRAIEFYRVGNYNALSQMVRG